VSFSQKHPLPSAPLHSCVQPINRSFANFPLLGANSLILTKVHAVFGYTLMLAGLARLLEACFVAPSYAPAADGVDDSGSDHTLADGAETVAATKGRVFRHLPPFVSDGIPFASLPR
jgi:hypothetical protein